MGEGIVREVLAAGISLMSVRAIQTASYDGEFNLAEHRLPIASPWR